MPEGMNVDGKGSNSFHISEEGLTLEEFAAKVKNDIKMMNIYKALDKNGDNILSRDELAQALGSYNQLDKNDDLHLSRKERKHLRNEIRNNLKSDDNANNDGLKLSKKSMNKFFDTIRTMVSPENQTTDIYKYNDEGKIVSGTNSKGKFIRSYSDDGKSYSDKYDNNCSEIYENGMLVSGIDNNGAYKVTRDGNSVSKTYTYSRMDDSQSVYVQFLDDKGNVVKETYDGVECKKLNHKDGGYTLEYVGNKSVINFDKSGNIISGVAPDG